MSGGHRTFLISPSVKLDATRQQLIYGSNNIASLFICTYDGMVHCTDINLESPEPAFTFPLPVYLASGGVAYIAGSYINGIQYIALYTYESKLIMLTRVLVLADNASHKLKSNITHKILPFLDGYKSISSLSFQPGTCICFAGTHDGLLYTINSNTGEIRDCNYILGLPIKKISYFNDKVYVLNQGGALRLDNETLVRAPINAFAIGTHYLVYGSFAVSVAINTKSNLADGDFMSTDIPMDSPISFIGVLNLQSLSSYVAQEILNYLSSPTHFTETIPDHTHHRNYEYFIIGTISGGLFILQACHSTRARKVGVVLHKVDIPQQISHESKIIQVLNYTEDGLITILFDDSSVARYSIIKN